MKIKYAISIGVDDWSRPLVKLAGGTVLADTNCGEGEPDWHTITDDWGEPIRRINEGIKIEVVGEEFKDAVEMIVHGACSHWDNCEEYGDGSLTWKLSERLFENPHILLNLMEG